MAACRCAPCNRIFVDVAARDAHFDSSLHHRTCTLCNTVFHDRQTKLQHIHNAHIHSFCFPCDRLFVSPRALQQHRDNAAEHGSSDEYDDADDSLYDSPDDADLHHQDRGDSVAPSDHSHHPIQQNLSPANRLRRVLGRPLIPDPIPFRTSSVDSSDDDIDTSSDSEGRDGTYLDDSSDGDDDTSSEDEQGLLSDLLEQSSDTDSDSSDNTPVIISADVHRSTITRSRINVPSAPTSTPVPGSSSQDPVSRAPFSTTASASSSSTLASRSSPLGKSFSKTGTGTGTASGYTCPLCLEQDGEPALELSSVKCGHVFCTPCITRALEKKHLCPVCRSRTKQKHLRRIYLNF